jgi:hypothetical protein
MRWNRTAWIRTRRAVVAAAAVAAIVGASCTSGGTSVPTGTAGAPATTIPQPVLPPDLAVAPDSQRVDLTMPTFSDPTNVTNPWFPVSQQASVLFLGHVDGKPFRTEVTLLPFTRIVEWNGQAIETLVSQYAAYLGGRLQEIAYDLYAQADDGSVWYFGEDVSDLAHGDIVTKEGTWIVGKDGPGAMIMPGDPQVGDAYRTENIPGIAFEEVTVKSVDRTLDGPLGPIPNGIVAEELHMGGGTEDKLFAPGYGEFYTASGSDVEALALAVPVDALSGPMPPELETLRSGAMDVFDAAESEDWGTASTSVAAMQQAWDAYRKGDVPVLIEPWMSDALARLTSAAAARDVATARQSALDVAQAALDLELRSRSPLEINLARMNLWAAQLLVDVEANDAQAVNGDVFTLNFIRDRVQGGISSDAVTSITTLIQRLQVSSFDGGLRAAAEDASQLRTTLQGVSPA